MDGILTYPEQRDQLRDPPALLAIARAAHIVGDRDLEAAALATLRDDHGIEVTFRPPVRRGGPGNAA